MKQKKRHKWDLRKEIFKEKQKKTKVKFHWHTTLSCESRLSDTQPQKIFATWLIHSSLGYVKVKACIS